MNGGSTSNRTPPHKQLPRMLLLIHDSHQSTINSQLVEVRRLQHLTSPVLTKQRTVALSFVEIRHDFPTATILQPSVILVAATARKKLTTQSRAWHAETRPMFYVFIEESEHIGLPLRIAKIKEVECQRS